MPRFALLVLLAIGCNSRDRLVSRGEPAPRLAISNAHQSFGGVRVGANTSATVRVSNDGDGPSAPLAPALTGDAAFAVDGTCAGEALAPGASCDLRVTFAPAAPGSAAATIAIADRLA